MSEEKGQAVVAPDAHEALMAALTRVREVPPSETLIDRLSDDEWTDSNSGSWKIECGSDCSDPDELDGCDSEKVNAA